MEDKGRIISLIIAAAVCILILIATRSCVRSAIQAKKEARENATKSTAEFHLITDPPITGQVEPPSLIDDGIEATTERQYETVTNILGKVIETIPVTTPEEANMPTTTLSIIEEYRQKSKNNNSDNSGGEGIEEPQTTTEYIEPKMDFTLVID